ncbi:MAG: type I methionyl aminopeptidase [Bacteroidia bacterium]|nr:type I methionyl aminopeptidase [Bacteroidia bacterium]
MLDIQYKSNEEIELIRESSLLVSETLTTVAKHIKPGVTTQYLDSLAEEFIHSKNAIPGFKGYGGFPSSLCISINEEVVHGIPGKREVKDGDLVSIDCGVLINQYYGDSAFTFAVGEISPELQKLMRVTKECLNFAIDNAKVGKRLGDISHAVQEHAEKNGFSVVRDLVGHGIGKSLHEKPEVPNFGKRGSGVQLKEGLVIAIEPMINLGRKQIKQLADGWTIRTADRKPSAHYEHTVAVREDGGERMSTFENIEKAVEENENLYKPTLVNG